MALIRDPNWTGPGPGPLIDDGTGSTDTDGRGQFTPEQAAAIDRAAQQAGGAFSGETQQYIDDLQAGRLGGGVDTLNALNILVQQGAAKLATSGGGSSGAVAAGTSGGGTGTVVPADSNETATTILRNTLKFYGLDQPELVRRNPHSPSQPHLLQANQQSTKSVSNYVNHQRSNDDSQRTKHDEQQANLSTPSPKHFS
jgi:hypothetical protein